MTDPSTFPPAGWPHSLPRPRWAWAVLLGMFLLSGCATARPGASGRPFDPRRDGFAYANETRWIYGVDPETGRPVHVVRDPVPDHTLRCFPMARAARQFHRHARFEPDLPPVSDRELRRRIDAILDRPDRRAVGDREPVGIPGFADLHDLSVGREALLQGAVGGAWRSYVQRGHWRMVFPFSRRHQRREAERIARRIRSGDPAVVHLVRFPDLSLNHAVVLHAVEDVGGSRVFLAYDPNLPGRELRLGFDGPAGRFSLPALPYFAGGPVSVYEVYRDPIH